MAITFGSGITIGPGISVNYAVAAINALTTAVGVITYTNPPQQVYAWDSTNGFGTKYAAAATGSESGLSGSFSPSGDVIMSCGYYGNTLHAYRWTSAGGFGTKYSTVTGNGDYGRDLQFSPSGNAVVVAGSGFGSYPWSSINGFGTKFSGYPAGAYSGGSFQSLNESLGFNTAGTVLVLPNSYYTSAYQWSDTTGIGTRYSFPGSAPETYPNSASFTPSDDTILIGHTTTPRISAYQWSYSTGFGTKYSNPSILPGAGVNRARFNADGTALIAGINTSPSLRAWAWNNGFGTKFTDPAVSPSYTQDLSFTKQGDSIIGSMDGTPYIYGQRWSNATGFGTRYSNPSTLPTAFGRKVMQG